MARVSIYPLSVAHLISRATSQTLPLADRLSAHDQLRERPALLRAYPRLADDEELVLDEQQAACLPHIEAALLRALELAGPCQSRDIVWRVEAGKIRRSLPWDGPDLTTWRDAP